MSSLLIGAVLAMYRYIIENITCAPKIYGIYLSPRAHVHVCWWICVCVGGACECVSLCVWEWECACVCLWARLRVCECMCVCVCVYVCVCVCACVCVYVTEGACVCVCVRVRVHVLFVYVCLHWLFLYGLIPAGKWMLFPLVLHPSSAPPAAALISSNRRLKRPWHQPTWLNILFTHSQICSSFPAHGSGRKQNVLKIPEQLVICIIHALSVKGTI